MIVLYKTKNWETGESMVESEVQASMMIPYFAKALADFDKDHPYAGRVLLRMKIDYVIEDIAYLPRKEGNAE